MKTLKQTYRFNAGKGMIWRMLVDPVEIGHWSGSAATMSEAVGAVFSLWGGSVHGSNKEVVTNLRLVQEWYGGDWKEPSEVTFTLEEREGETVVELAHTNIPDEEYEEIAMGWKVYVFEPIRHYLASKVDLPDVEYHQGG